MRALTLTELLIATTIVGIIMMGVVSSDYAVRKSFQSQSADALLSLHTRVIVNDIIKNAALASGYKNDLGIRTLDANNFCIRQDPKNLPTPMDYSDDPWVCYTTVPNSALYTCAKPAGAVPPAACATSDQKLGAVVSVAPSFDPATDTFSVTIVNRDDPGNPKSISNPEVTVTSQTSPAGQSL